MEYKKLVLAYSLLTKTSKRLEKTHLISELLKSTPAKELEMVCLLIQGNVYPAHAEEKLGVSEKLVIKAISIVSGHSQQTIENLWREFGDLGDVAFKLNEKKKQATLFSTHLTVKKVFDNIHKLPELTGPGSTDHKIKAIAELLSHASPLESKYIVRTTLSQLRMGVATQTLRDAITWAFLNPPGKYDDKSNKWEITDEQRKEYNKLTKAVQHAYDVINDFGEVATLAKEQGVEGLQKVELAVGTPLKAMLTQKADDIGDAFAQVGSPALFEYKYDGFRIQIHKEHDDVQLFTRRLDRVTDQFPDAVEAIKEHIKAERCILDGEIIGFNPRTKEYLPFQNISQRIKRKHNIAQLSKDCPVEVVVFDIMLHNSESQLQTPMKERRELIEKIVHKQAHKVTLSKAIITGDAHKATDFLKEAKEDNQEGLMGKALDAPYQPGSRVGSQVKVKFSLDPLDLVIVGAEWGEGKRSGWLTSFTLACKDGDKFLTTGKVGTGVKEKEEAGLSFEELTNLLKPHITKEDGRSVTIKPKVVVEVLSDEIQKSPTYESGFALRFPRILRVRNDKPPSEIATKHAIEKEHNVQH